MSRRMDRRQRLVARAQNVAIGKTVPCDVVLRVLIGPRQLRERRGRMRGRDRRRARRVIAVTVRDEDELEAGATRVERRGEIGKVSRLADARIDERRRSIASGEKVRVVAGARHRTGIVRGEKDRRQHFVAAGLHVGPGQKLYRSAAFTCEFRWYWPRKSPLCPAIATPVRV